MKFVSCTMIAGMMLASVSGPAMAQGHAAPSAQGKFVNADGTRTDDLEAAAATWRALSEFQGDHAKQQIGAEYAYARGITGKTMKVGVSDSGVEPMHPTFSAPGKVIYIDVTHNLLDGAEPREGEYYFDGAPFYRVGTSPDHGSHVSGTIGAPRDGEEMMGVAFDTTIVSATLALGSDLLDEERYRLGKKRIAELPITNQKLIASGARIVNNSWGFPLVEVTKARDKTWINYFDTIALVPGDADLERVNSALQLNTEYLDGLSTPMAAAGVVMVFSAGNDSGAHASPQASAPLLAPDVESHWLSVVNLDPSGNELHESSNVCGHTKAWCLAAPGTDINSAIFVRKMNQAAVAEAAAMTPLESRDAYRKALKDLRETLGHYKAAYEYADMVPEYEAQLARTRQQNPDGEALGKQWARQLFDIVMKYQNAPNVLEAKAAGHDIAMDLFLGAKARFGKMTKDDDLTLDLISLISVLGLIDVSEQYEWDASPLYHMDLEYDRLVYSATDLTLTNGLNTGTSMAAPHVSAGLALVMERFPYMPSDVARDTLLTTATDLGDAGVDPMFGWGRMNIGQAMRGPSALLRDVKLTLGAGVSDSWDNDIADGSAFLGDRYRGALTLGGEGTLTLNGDNSYLGHTNVRGGKLIVNGALRSSGAFVFDGATIGGGGTLKSLVVESGGTIAPGNSIGTLKVAGDLTFRKGSFYELETSVNATESDRIEVGGTATIEGGTVKLKANQGKWNIRSKAEVLTSVGGVTGAFDKLESNLGFLDGLLAYGPNAVTLTLRRNDVTFSSAGRTRNQRAVGRALDGLAERGPLFDALVDGGVDAVSASLDSFTGETHASLAAAAVNDAAYVRDAMLRRMPHSMTAVGAVEAENRTASGVTAWGQALAGFSTTAATPGIAAMKTNGKGFITGIDKNWDDRVNAGVAFSHVDTDVNVFRPGSNNNGVRSWHAGGYLSAEVGRVRARTGGSWGWYSNNMSRSASVNGFSDNLRDTYKGRAWQTFGEFGFGFEKGSLSFEPYANITHIDYRSGRIDERGGRAALAGRATQKATMSTLGLRTAAKLLPSADGRAGFARVNIGWRHDLDNSGAVALLSIEGSPKTFSVVGAEPGKNLGIIDLAIDLPASHNLDFGFNYGGQYSSQYESHSLKATVQFRF